MNGALQQPDAFRLGGGKIERGLKIILAHLQSPCAPGRTQKEEKLQHAIIVGTCLETVLCQERLHGIAIALVFIDRQIYPLAIFHKLK